MSLLDPDVTYEDASLPDHVGETYRGHEGVARALARWLEPYVEFTIDLERIEGAGNRLVSVHGVRTRARHTVRDGQLVRMHDFSTREDALEAAAQLQG